MVVELMLETPLMRGRARPKEKMARKLRRMKIELISFMLDYCTM
jgi:hypothetical protein